MPTLYLQSLVYGGDAFARDESGRAVFVPFGLPGETVRVKMTTEKKRFARARIVEILEPSPDRVEPRCRHFGECGGCHYQHLNYPAQLAAKRQILVEQLTRLGGFQDPPVRETIPAPHPWSYRNHTRFSIHPDGRPGYRATRSRRVLPISECPILAPAMADLWPRLDLEPDLDLDSLSLRADARGDHLLIFESRSGEPPALELDLPLSSVHLRSDGSSLVMAGSDHILAEIMGRPFRVSAGSFFQVNTPVAEAIVRRVLEALDLQGDETVLDLYCGVGLFSAFIAPHAARLIAVEASPTACADFEANLDEFENVELYEAPVEEALPALTTTNVEAVVLDPPRAGLSSAVKQALLTLAPRKIIYVSCDPATLARDLARLVHHGGYTLQHTLPLDLFPQTYHIESISLINRTAPVGPTGQTGPGSLPRPAGPASDPFNQADGSNHADHRDRPDHQTY